MKKKGFTLIELLAVIVILAIIALIATPLVLKYIEKSRKESKVDSTYSFVRNLETQMANYAIENNGKKYPAEQTITKIADLPGLNINVKGENPTDGKVCISSDGQIEKGIFEFNDGKYYVSYDGKNGSMSDETAYSSFSCGGSVVKVEVPEATKEFNIVGMINYGSIKNNQEIIYYSDTEERKEALEREDNPFYYGWNYINSYEVPTSKFNQIPPADNSSIPVEIVFLDGTTATINLEYKENGYGEKYWYYKNNNDLPYHQYDEGWYIYFTPYCDNYNDSCSDNYQYHNFYTSCGMDTSHGWQSLTILGTTLYFDSDIANLFMSVNEDTGDDNLVYQDLTKLTRIIVNYEDNTQDVYSLSDITEENFEDGTLVLKNSNKTLITRDKYALEIHYKNNQLNYKDDIFKDMPKVSTVTFEENGVMTTYKISDNPMIAYGGMGE